MLNINFNKQDYIANYKFTLREFDLMGSFLKIAYSDKVCGHFLAKVPNVGDEFRTSEYISSSCFDYYFNHNGCYLQVGDHGEIPITIKRVSHDVCKPTEGAKQQLEAYRLEVASAKAEIISGLLREFFLNIINNIETENDVNINGEDLIKIITTFESDLLSKIYMDGENAGSIEVDNALNSQDNEENVISKVELTKAQKDRLISAELFAKINVLNFGRETTISGSPNLIKEYCEYLRSQNYQVAEENTKAIVRKLMSN